MEQNKIEPYTIKIQVAQSKDASNIASITMQVDTEAEVTYNQIISTLMTLTESLIESHKKITDEQKNLQLEQTSTTTTQETI